jgi:hypothetical protein
MTWSGSSGAVWSALVDENLAQRGAQTPGFDVGQAGEVTAGELNLDDVGSPSPKVQCRRSSLDVPANNAKVMPAQPSEQCRGGYRTR